MERRNMGTMKNAPLIGVIDGNAEVEKSIEDTGGIVVVLDDEDIFDTLDPTALDGIALCGGTDVNPKRYATDKHDQVWMVDNTRDELEFRAIKYSQEYGIPILGICRGAQVTNVALGGTLHQHIDDFLGSGKHFMGNHSIEVMKGSRLSKATKATGITVNSLHHQAVDRLGEGLIPTAWSHDGVIECVESLPWANQWIMGVQFHPEMMQYRSDMQNIVRLFLRAARVHSKPKAKAILRSNEVDEMLTKLDVEKGRFRADDSQTVAFGWSDDGWDEWDKASWERLNQHNLDKWKEVDDICAFGPCRYPGGCDPKEGDCLAEAVALAKPIRGSKQKRDAARDLERELEDGLDEMGFSVMRDYHYGG